VPRDAELQELHGWYRDWAHTARAVIARRDYLILLGVVERKKRNASSNTDADSGPIDEGREA
jgi:hypothetical protein